MPWRGLSGCVVHTCVDLFTPAAVGFSTISVVSIAFSHSTVMSKLLKMFFFILGPLLSVDAFFMCCDNSLKAVTIQLCSTLFQLLSVTLSTCCTAFCMCSTPPGSTPSHPCMLYKGPLCSGTE